MKKCALGILLLLGVGGCVPLTPDLPLVAGVTKCRALMENSPPDSVINSAYGYSAEWDTPVWGGGIQPSLIVYCNNAGILTDYDEFN